MLRKIFALAATALFTQAASADVLYTWQQVEHSPSMPDGLHLELLFTDAAVAKGALDLNLINLCSYGNCSQQQDSLLALRYWYAGPDGQQHWNTIDYRMGDETRFGYQRLSMALEFSPGGKLTGLISANDGFSDFTMQSKGRVFTMLSAHSDEPYGCGFAYRSCEGERGLLSSVSATAQSVPEPGGPATLAIGAMALWGALSRRKR
jgi:uncharacterized protein (TIGR03382 family)